jgi:hypothetical protein
LRAFENSGTICSSNNAQKKNEKGKANNCAEFGAVKVALVLFHSCTLLAIVTADELRFSGRKCSHLV